MKDPKIAWGTHKDNHDKLRELEHLWAKSAGYSYLYAMYVLKNRFPRGEDAIATNAFHSYRYAFEVLKPLGIKGFPKGEAAIATDAEWSLLYAEEVLRNRFPKGEDAIRRSGYQKDYEKLFGVKL